MGDASMIGIIITSLVSLLCGGGGVLAFINVRQKNSQDNRAASVVEWKQLYDEMKSRLDIQEDENRQLRNELAELKVHIVNLKSELDMYKRYDNYVYELESYIDTTLIVVKSFVTDESYSTLVNKRPTRPKQLHPEEGE